MTIERRMFPARRVGMITAGLLLGGSLLIGCGGGSSGPEKPQGDATITITYGGVPVTEGRVDLVNEQTGDGGGAKLDETGTATFSGVVQGNYTVTVLPPLPENLAPIPGQPPPKAKEAPNIPETFRRAATSPLRAEIKGDATEYQFDLRQQ